MTQSEGNDTYNFDKSETYIDIGLKGTKADGLVQKRMSAIKEQMNDTLKDLMKGNMKQGGGGDQKKGAEALKNMLQGTQSQELFQNIINIEVDKLKKDAREKKKEYERKLLDKTNKINELLTDLENKQTEMAQATMSRGKQDQDNEVLTNQIALLEQKLEMEKNESNEIAKKH